MTPEQKSNAELLRELGRPAEAISANTGTPVEIVKAWLKSGRWPKSQQPNLFDEFDAGATSRETTKPATVGHSHGLHLLARAAGGQDQRSTATHSGTERE